MHIASGSPMSTVLYAWVQNNLAAVCWQLGLLYMFCLSITFRLWWTSLWCTKWACWCCFKLEEYRHCFAAETWLLTEHWHQIQQWSSCMLDMDGDGVAYEKLWCTEVWWANLATVGEGCRPPCRWSKHGTCKENSQETQGWRYVLCVVLRV